MLWVVDCRPGTSFHPSCSLSSSMCPPLSCSSSSSFSFQHPETHRRNCWRRGLLKARTISEWPTVLMKAVLDKQREQLVHEVLSTLRSLGCAAHMAVDATRRRTPTTKPPAHVKINATKLHSVVFTMYYIPSLHFLCLRSYELRTLGVTKMVCQ